MTIGKSYRKGMRPMTNSVWVLRKTKRKEVALSWLVVMLNIVGLLALLISLCTLLIHRLTKLVDALMILRHAWHRFKHQGK